MSNKDLIKWHQKQRKKARVGSAAYWFHLQRGIMLRKEGYELVVKNPFIISQS